MGSGRAYRSEPISPGLPSGQKRAARRGRLPIVGAALLGTAVAIWFGLATVGAWRVAFPDALYTRPNHGGPPPDWTTHPELADPRAAFGADFQNLMIARRDGLKLAAWWIPASKPAGIVIMHGAGNNRHDVLPFAKFIHAAGYPVIALDEIDHGDSDDAGWGVGYGWRQRDDVLAAVAELRARGLRQIGALGFSQGAAAAIFAEAESNGSLAAIVSDSAYANLGAMMRQMPSIAGLNPLFADTIFFESGFWIGASPDRIAPAQAAGHLGGCALMVIHGAADTVVPVANAQAIYAAAHGDKELWHKEIWIVPKADHIVAFENEPDEYSRRVTGFFDRYLLAAPGGATTRP
ncbi:MAG: alpha/beta hydrolase [Candidatus Binatales bacterium]